MRYLFIALIRLYQVVGSPFLATAAGSFSGCRYEVSCSEYAIEMYKTHGAIKGSIFSIRRILSCRP